MGFTLLEAMIALLVLSIGLLGIAALQAQGLRYNTDSYIRSQATILAYDIIERMRINSTNAAAYVGGLPAAECGEEGADLAENDRACWHAGVAAVLPGGNAEIVGNVGGNPDAYRITVTWFDRQSGEEVDQEWTVVVAP